MSPTAPALDPATPQIVPLFATPLVIVDLPEAAALNAELRGVIEQRQKSHPSTQHSNLGGCHRAGAAQVGPAGDVPGLDDAPGAALSRHRRAHLHRLQSDAMSLLLGAGGMQPPNCAAVVLGQLAWEIAVKYLPLLAVACVAAVAACEYREQTTV